jgi:hypothetical protein
MTVGAVPGKAILDSPLSRALDDDGAQGERG